MPATLNSSPSFPKPFGSVFGFVASQWAQLFAQKVDIEGGIADNLTVTGTLTLAGFQTAPLTGASPPLKLSGGTMSLAYDPTLFQLSGSGALTLEASAVTNAYLATMAANTIKGSVGGGNPSDLTATQVTAMLNVFTALLQGLVPASGGGTSNFLRADGSWAAPTSTSIPTGTVAAFAVSTPPSGWLNCDGSAVSRSTYATLFGVVGTTYGAGNGTTTFNLPDGRGRTMFGWDSGNATGRLTGSPTGGISASSIANVGGEQGHTLTTPGELPAHSHGVTDPTHTHTVVDGGHIHTTQTPVNNTGSFGTGANPPSASASGVVANTFALAGGASNATTGIGLGNASTGITTQNTGSGGAHNTVPPGLVISWIIKT